MDQIDEFGGWPTLLGVLVAGGDLTAAQSAAALSAVLAGEATSAQTAGFIVALRQKGETVAELDGLVAAMLDAAAPLELPAATIDIVGTGGSPRRRTRALNVSTMASLVAASAGAAARRRFSTLMMPSAMLPSRLGKSLGRRTSEREQPGGLYPVVAEASCEVEHEQSSSLGPADNV